MTKTAVGTGDDGDLTGQFAAMRAELTQAMTEIRERACRCNPVPGAYSVMYPSTYPVTMTTTAMPPSIIWQSTTTTG